MCAFKQSDIDRIDDIWRRLCSDHPWTGWAFMKAHDGEVWLFRKRANWRRFILTHHADGFRLEDESGDDIRNFQGLDALPDAIADMPTLEEHYNAAKT